MPPPDKPEDDIQSIPPFYNGQITTAGDLNRLVDALKQLDRRLASLEDHCRAASAKP
jgi:hypothetical protein